MNCRLHAGNCKQYYLVFDALVLMIAMGKVARENDDRISLSQYSTISYVLSC